MSRFFNLPKACYLVIIVVISDMAQKRFSSPLRPGWLPLGAVFAAGIDERTLTNWRERHLIPRPAIVPTPRGGTATYYPPETPAIIRRVRELQRQSRSAAEWLWRLWLEGQPVEMLPWARRRLEALASKVEKARGTVTSEELQEYAKRRRVYDGRTMSPSQEAELLDAALDTVIGEFTAIERADTFYTLLKVAGLPDTGAFPLPELELIELLSPRRQAAVVIEATEDEAEQARRDWQAIERIVMAAERVDWDAVMPAVRPFIAKVTGAPPDPPSWRARKAKRKKPRPPPAIVGRLLETWRNFNGRAMVLAFLIGARRDEATSKRITELFAQVEWVLSLFPRTQRNLPATP
jgi:hypothetical protein